MPSRPRIRGKKEYFSEVMPGEMGEAREVTDYSEILFERNGKKIKAKAKELWEVENGRRANRIPLSSSLTRISSWWIT